MITERTYVEPTEVSEADLEKIHDPGYLQALQVKPVVFLGQARL